ncbi:MAG: hypothetical protein A2Z25_16335 [Planctomycetes bacterium RBG_16_55_9]|nr:MAG: hypothetical protein A2Z25_16335 [Planctomycetes bacterium RBG_16_55_9]
MKVKVNQQLCIGTGVCEQICPEVFEVKEGISRVKGDNVPPEFERRCTDAIQGCPTGAISIKQ